MNYVTRLCTRLGGLKLASVAAAAVVSLLASAVRAEVPVPVAFELQISPVARVLDAVGEPFFMEVWKDESWDNPHLRVRNRNKPAFMLTNDLMSVAPITSFTLTINEGPYLFGNGDTAIDGFTNFVKNTMYTDAGVTITGSSLSPDGKSLTVNFDGLAPGKKAIFCVDLDANDMNMFPFPDYRNVLFGAPTSVGGTPTDAASYAVKFTDDSAAPNMQTLDGEFDQMTSAPDFQNDTIRPYVVMDMVEITTVGGQIPEPTGAVLALVGMAALAGLRRRA